MLKQLGVKLSREFAASELGRRGGSAAAAAGAEVIAVEEIAVEVIG